MASPERRDERPAQDASWKRPEEQPMWQHAIYGIGWVVAMAVAVTVVGLALAVLATLVL